MIKTLQKRAFTLIELLVVIAIIGILASLIIVSLSGARTRATDTQLKNNLRNLATGLEQFYVDQNGKYPSFTTASGANISAGQIQAPAGTVSCTAITGAAVDTLGACIGPYLGSGATSQTWTYDGVNAKYITATTASYLAATSLKSSNEALATTGNGVYAVVGTANNGTVTAGGLTVGANTTGMNVTFASTRAFATYGPQ